MTINIPNIITVIRILLTPLFVIFLLKDLFFYALIIFTIASISDGLDGFLARYFNQRTEMGAFLDPIADKLLLMAAFICLAVLKIVPEWLSVIVISRDVLIVTGIGVLSIKEIKIEINPTVISKLTTFAQLSAIFFTLLSLEYTPINTIKQPLFWLTACLTVLSGLHYVYIGLNIFQKAMENNHHPK